MNTEEIYAYAAYERMIPRLFGGVIFWKNEFDAMLSPDGEYSNDIINALSLVIRHNGEVRQLPFRKDYIFAPCWGDDQITTLDFYTEYASGTREDFSSWHTAPHILIPFRVSTPHFLLLSLDINAQEVFMYDTHRVVPELQRIESVTPFLIALTVCLRLA